MVEQVLEQIKPSTSYFINIFDKQPHYTTHSSASSNAINKWTAAGLRP